MKQLFTAIALMLALSCEKDCPSICPAIVLNGTAYSGELKIDGVKAGRLELGGTLSTTVATGSHTFSLKPDPGFASYDETGSCTCGEQLSVTIK